MGEVDGERERSGGGAEAVQGTHRTLAQEAGLGWGVADDEAAPVEARAVFLQPAGHLGLVVVVEQVGDDAMGGRHGAWSDDMLSTE